MSRYNLRSRVCVVDFAGEPPPVHHHHHHVQLQQLQQPQQPLQQQDFQPEFIEALRGISFTGPQGDPAQWVIDTLLTQAQQNGQTVETCLNSHTGFTSHPEHYIRREGWMIYDVLQQERDQNQHLFNSFFSSPSSHSLH